MHACSKLTFALPRRPPAPYVWTPPPGYIEVVEKDDLSPSAQEAYKLVIDSIPTVPVEVRLGPLTCLQCTPSEFASGINNCCVYSAATDA